ncbi:hypothetical protein GCM10010492_67100 [Saccharothrix mutabilis subsp. mutabilis]|uniref:Uncharacterized protein n=1 Tax=Saccharothrix mutabilis subsp. mutabilis TaxID=66855 RepID=A0ABP3ECU6_9PSEU
MPPSARDAADVGRRIVECWPDRARNDRIHRYVKGDHDLPFAPRGSKALYMWTLRKSRTNWCRLLVQILAQNLFVDGIRATGRTEGDAGPWQFWTANRMTRRQSAVHRAALKYGLAFVSALPGEPGPVIRGTPRAA